MRMLRWTRGVTREDRIRNEYVRGSIRVTLIVNKMRDYTFRWFDHIMRKDNLEAVRTIMEVDVKGRSRSKKKSVDAIRFNMRTAVCR